MDLVKQPFLVGDSLLLSDSPFLLLLGFPGCRSGFFLLGLSLRTINITGFLSQSDKSLTGIYQMKVIWAMKLA